ncbi:MAG: hypothetical protein JNJ54_16545 [Myxococcaceae bacterium]|nr:hypothetical protein [Myxococcaceae bacterium]
MRALVAPLVACLALACPKKNDQAPPAPPPTAEPALPLPESPRTAVAMPPRPDAEVEVVGKWSSKVPGAKKHVAVAQVEPCVPVPVNARRFGDEVVLEGDGYFFEYFMPQGTRAHVCLYALDDKGVVIGAVTIPDTPRVFEGLGELMVGPHTVEIVPLAR